MESCKEMYEESQKKAKQSKIMPFFTESYVSPSAVHFTLFDHPNNFQLGTPVSFHKLFHCSSSHAVLTSCIIVSPFAVSLRLVVLLRCCAVFVGS
jgi:hypothetical protein